VPDLISDAAGVRLEITDELATVTLNRPQRRNAMTPLMWHRLAEIGAGLPEIVRVVVVRGEDPAFCAGIDLRMFTPDGVPGEGRGPDASDPEFEDVVAGYQDGFRWLRNPQFVSIAAVQGHAIGAGFQLALACDLRILASNAKLCMKEPALGLVPDLTGTKPLVGIVGLPRAIELCLTAREISAADAEQFGLAERVVAADELTVAVDQLVKDLLAVPAAAARATKALLQGAPARTLDEQAGAERAAQKELLSKRAD
jgi:enoyl-CoA hydratase/carnithine racemase